MKGFNIVLSVLIFLLAIVSAVFSFFLFEKRTQLVDGWGVLTKEINLASAAMDMNSGTQTAQKLTPKELAHTEYPEVPGRVKNLTSQAKDVAAQRDNLAETLNAVAHTMEINDVRAEQLMNVQSSKSTAQKIADRIRTCKTRQDDILAKLCAMAGQIGAPISVQALKGANYNVECGKVAARVGFWLTRHQAFCSGFNAIARNIGVSAPNLSDGSYADSIRNLAEKARKLKESDTKNANDLAAARAEIRRLNGKVADLNSQVSSLTQNLEARKKEIGNLCQILGLEAYQEPIADGSVAARRMLKGEVVSVDKKFGFVVVSIGSKTRVTEPYGNRIHEIDPKIREEALMTVGRNMDGASKFVCRIKLARLNDNCAVGEIQPGSENVPKKGDMVYLSDEDIAALGK